MGQVLRPDSIGTITRVSNTQITVAPTLAIVGGQQRQTSSTITINKATTGLNGIDTGTVAANKLYNIFLVINNGNVGAVISLSSAPTGFPAYRLIGQCTTDGSANFIWAANDTDQAFLVETLGNASVSNVNTTSSTTTCTITIPASVVKLNNKKSSIGAQQVIVGNAAGITNGLNRLDAGALTPSSSVAGHVLYYVYAVLDSSNTVGYVISLNSSTPSGTWIAYTKIGHMTSYWHNNLSPAYNLPRVRALNGISVDNAPIGTIVPSMLDEAAFIAMHGPSWILADGRPVAGSKYALTVGSTAPDLRGVFLRGSNAAAIGNPLAGQPTSYRSDGYQDPTGLARIPGTMQTSGVPNITGTIELTYGAARSNLNSPTNPLSGALSGGSTESAPTYPNSVSQSSISIDASASHVDYGTSPDEVRVKNAAVNHFIRIN